MSGSSMLSFTRLWFWWFSIHFKKEEKTKKILWYAVFYTLYRSWHVENSKRTWRFSKKKSWNIINKEGFVKTDFVHLILFTTLPPYFLQWQFSGNRRRWSIVKCFYCSSDYLTCSFTSKTYNNIWKEHMHYLIHQLSWNIHEPCQNTCGHFPRTKECGALLDWLAKPGSSRFERTFV